MRIDQTGQFWDYVFDAAFLAWGIYDVVQDPTDGWAWAGLGIDLVLAVIPFIPSGAGQGMKATAKIANKVDDVVDAGKALNKVDNITDTLKSINGVDNFLDSGGVIRKATALDLPTTHMTL